MKKTLLFLSITICTIANAQFTKLIDFNITNGRYPYGDLISDGTFLYGMTGNGGTNTYGVIFKIKPDGTGYSKLLDFAGATHGISPQGSLISNGTFLYGMTSAGGSTNYDGSIFKIKSDGTGSSDLFDFSGAANGQYPQGSLISDGTFLYGMTQHGGLNNMGVIFKYQDSTATGVAVNNMENNFTICPNPTNGKFTVQIQDLKVTNLEIYNVIGEKVYSSIINSPSSVINLNTPNGIYFLQLKTENGIAVKKIILSK